jgi:hypothetical protein
MVDTILKVLTPATSQDLLTLAQLKQMLNILPTDTSQDANLQTYITQYSEIIAIECSRVFGYEEMRETLWCLQPRRYYVSHWPVLETDIQSIEAPRGGYVYQPGDWEVEEESGKIELYAARDEPIVVTYSGGYHLPDEAPPSLQAACEIMIRAAMAMARIQAVSGVRSISHKDARVMFFDPNAALKFLGAPLTAAVGSVQSLLQAYRRYWV